MSKKMRQDRSLRSFQLFMSVIGSQSKHFWGCKQHQLQVKWEVKSKQKKAVVVLNKEGTASWRGEGINAFLTTAFYWAVRSDARPRYFTPWRNKPITVSNWYDVVSGTHCRYWGCWVKFLPSTVREQLIAWSLHSLSYDGSSLKTNNWGNTGMCST